MILLNNPDLVATSALNLASAVWFFMMPQSPKPSMMDVIDHTWMPNAVDQARNLANDFGTTTVRHFVFLPAEGADEKNKCTGETRAQVNGLFRTLFVQNRATAGGRQGAFSVIVR